jgi:hypothetical protein
MKPPRVRFTVRRMMVAVAVVGLLFWGAILAGRSIYYGLAAQALVQKRQAYLVDLVALEKRAGKGLTPNEARLVAYGHRMVDYIARQRAVYLRAARHPWEPVAFEPPPRE